MDAVELEGLLRPEEVHALREVGPERSSSFSTRDHKQNRWISAKG